MQHIHVYRHKITTLRIQQDDAFTFRKDRKHHWLQRACLSILKKLGCYAHMETEKVERIPIDARDFMQGLFEQKEEIAEHFYEEGNALLVGPDQYREIMRLMSSPEWMSFGIRVGREVRPEIMGLTVYVVPWMSGYLVLPHGMKVFDGERR